MKKKYGPFFKNCGLCILRWVTKFELLKQQKLHYSPNMTTDNGIQELLDKIDNLTDLIAKVKIAEQYKDIQRIKSETLEEYQSKIQEAEHEIEGNLYYTSS